MSKENAGLLNWEKGIMGAPDLVIEILSKGNTKGMMEAKKLGYKKFGVKEFWIVDEKTKQNRQYLLSDGKFQVSIFEGGLVNIKLLDLLFNY